MDLDWCLTCEKRIESPTTSSPLYCSLQCQPTSTARGRLLNSRHREELDEDDISLFHHINSAEAFPHVSRWKGNDFAGIHAWAGDIPAGASPEHPSPRSNPGFRMSSITPTSLDTRALAPPNLIKPSRRLVPPSLSITDSQTTVPPTPSNPIVTPRRQTSFLSMAQAAANASMGQRSAATESSLVATPPPSKPVPIGVGKKSSRRDGLYNDFVSWNSPNVLPPSYLPQFPKHAPAYAPVKIVSSPRSSCIASEQSPMYWTAGPPPVKQVTSKRPPYDDLRPSKVTNENFACHEAQQHPFRTRGRKPSRAAV
ncbi:hypothetical protein CPC08DRAFT_762025 [Agrocybe pediades]|nr:hypothetical protein CPC08DRAFT_762025 [Agrocybe pediades]